MATPEEIIQNILRKHSQTILTSGEREITIITDDIIKTLLDNGYVIQQYDQAAWKDLLKAIKELYNG